MKPLWVLHIWAVGVEKQTGWKNFLFCQNIRETASAVKQFISWKKL